MAAPGQSRHDAAAAGSADGGGGSGKAVVIDMDADIPFPYGETPSEADGVPSEVETDLRVYGCQLIQDTGLLLHLRQVVMACAQILFQRYFWRKSMVGPTPVEMLALAALFTASKVEEAKQQSLRAILLVGWHVIQRRADPQTTPEPLDTYGSRYLTLKSEVVKAERRLLKELGFCVHVSHPHKLIISFQGVLGLGDHEELAQAAWSYMNDALRTKVFVCAPLPAVACACLHLATLRLGIPMPEWWVYFDAPTEQIEAIASSILALYKRPLRPLAELKAELQKLKDARLASARVRAGAGAGAAHAAPSSASASAKAASEPPSKPPPATAAAKLGPEHQARLAAALANIHRSTAQSRASGGRGSARSSRGPDSRPPSRDRDRDRDSTSRERGSHRDDRHRDDRRERSSSASSAHQRSHRSRSPPRRDRRR